MPLHKVNRTIGLGRDGAVACAAGIASFVVAAIAAGCGGGGGASTGEPAGSSGGGSQAAASTYPTAKPIVGDWYVYEQTRTSTAAGPASRSYSRYYRSFNADGSFVRLDTSSDSPTYVRREYDSERRAVAFKAGDTVCTYAPGFRNTPPNGAIAGQSFSESATRTCLDQVRLVNSTAQITTTGTSLGVESRSVEAGTFQTFKYRQTSVTTAESVRTTSEQTCWIDMLTGRTVECQDDYTTVAADGVSVTDRGTIVERLKAYSFQGQSTSTPTIATYAGYWQVRFEGTSVGYCEDLLVSSAGAISGACRILTGAGIYTQPFGVTGSVNADGSATIRAETGASLSGRFTSPVYASGSYTNAGGAAGTWTAFRGE